MGPSINRKRIWKCIPSKKYTVSLSDIPLGRLSEHLPGEKFANSPLNLGEIKNFFRKSRARSSSGINGISYKLYKRYPKILALLWKL